MLYQESPHMIKKLTKHGNSRALILERGVLDLLHIGDDTPLDISTDGRVLIISPVRDPKRKKKFEAAMEQVNQQYGRALRNLA